MKEKSTLKVLLADDSSSFLHFEKVILSSQNFELRTASDGMEALRKAKEHKPDIALLDINMPEMNGYEVCRMIKNNPDLEDIKIIMVTTKGEDEDVEEGYSVGCDAYLFKPVRKKELLEKIEEVRSN